MTDDPLEDNVRSIGDRAANGEGEEPEQELFPIGSLEGDQKTLKNLIKGGLPVETTVSLRSAEVPLRGGLPDPEKLQRMTLTAEFAKCEPVPVREGEGTDRKIVGWKVRVVLRPTYVEPIADAAAEDAA